MGASNNASAELFIPTRVSDSTVPLVLNSPLSILSAHRVPASMRYSRMLRLAVLFIYPFIYLLIFLICRSFRWKFSFPSRGRDSYSVIALIHARGFVYFSYIYLATRRNGQLY